MKILLLSFSWRNFLSPSARPLLFLCCMLVNVQAFEQGCAYRGKGRSQVPSLAISSFCLNPGTPLTEGEAYGAD